MAIERSEAMVSSEMGEVRAGGGPDCEDPALDIELDNDDLDEGEDDGADDDERAAEVPEIDDDLDDSQYPGL